MAHLGGLADHYDQLSGVDAIAEGIAARFEPHLDGGNRGRSTAAPAPSGGPVAQVNVPLPPGFDHLPRNVQQFVAAQMARAGGSSHLAPQQQQWLGRDQQVPEGQQEQHDAVRRQ